MSTLADLALTEGLADLAPAEEFVCLAPAEGLADFDLVPTAPVPN